MKNLFEFATKELSQDAFLRWLVENWDEPDNKELQKASRDFLSFLANNKYDDLDFEKAKVVTFGQINHMDISIDVYPDKNTSKHDIIVIEDKTGSNEHDQLTSYNKTIEKWKTAEDVRNVYKVFYKTGSLSNQDEKGLKEANEGQKSKWRKVLIEDIWGFFHKYNNASSDVLRDYSRYVDRLYNASKGNVEEKDVSKLIPLEWEGLIRKWYQESDIKPHEVWVTSYQGRYISICYHIDFKNKGIFKEEDVNGGACLEIFVRDKKWCSAVLHNAFKIPDRKDRAWSIKDVQDEKRFECAKKLRGELVEFVKNDTSGHFKTVKKNALSCFGKIGKESQRVDTLEEAEDLIKKWVNWFKELIADFDK